MWCEPFTRTSLQPAFSTARLTRRAFAMSLARCPLVAGPLRRCWQSQADKKRTMRRRRQHGSCLPAGRWRTPGWERPRLTGMADTDQTTHRLRALEIALRDAERHARNVVDHSPLGICAVGLDGRLLSANPALEAMLGAPGAPAASSLADLVDPGDLAAV